MAVPIGGRVTISVDGEVLAVGDAVSYAIGGVERETVESLSGANAFSEKSAPAFVEFTLLVDETVSLASIGEVTDAVVQLETPTRTIIFRGAHSVKAPDVDAATGKATLRFETGPYDVTEVLSA